jgi:hypothetical protein
MRWRKEVMNAFNKLNLVPGMPHGAFLLVKASVIHAPTGRVSTSRTRRENDF